MDLIQDYNILYKSLLITILVFVIFLTFLKSSSQKIIYGTFTFFYFLYNGLGMSFGRGVHELYYEKYVGFYLVLSFSFFFFGKVFLKEIRFLRRSTSNFFTKFSESKYLIYSIVIFYLFLSFVPLIYPEFKVMRLFSPPAPDLIEQFKIKISASSSGKIDPINKIVNNIQFLLYPFYLLSLSYFRRKPVKLFIVLFLPLYFHYCEISYINRGLVLEILFIYGAILWYYVPKFRKFIITALIVVVPILPILLFNYTQIRQGRSAKKVNTLEAVESIIEIEAIMPTFSKKIFNSNKKINKRNYYIWVITLPIPKVIIGSVPRVSAGTEMSEILLGRKEGSKGYYALLAGLVNESVYMYGEKLFFLHAILIGFLMAFAARITEYSDILFPILLVYTILFSYTLCRAGIASTLPQFINKFFSLYIILGTFYFWYRFKLK